MRFHVKQLAQTLIEIDKEVQKLDGMLKDLRLEIHSALLELVEVKKEQARSKIE